MKLNARRFSITSAIFTAVAVNPAVAAELSIRFGGGGTEITLAPNQWATIEVVFTGDDWGSQEPSKVTGMDARFDVGTLAAGIGGDYVLNNSNDFSVWGVGTYPGWYDQSSSPFPRPLGFLFVGDPQGVNGPANEPNVQVVLASLTFRKDTPTVGDSYVIFQVNEVLPMLYEGSQAWTHRWQYDTITGPRQFRLGAGNPGDADPRFPYHGYETLQPLVIHQVPEPGVVPLLGLGVVLVWRRRAGRAR